LLARERVLGVIHVGTLTPRIFTPDDMELLQLAAERVAMGIHKALLHDELLRLAELRHRFVSTAAHELRTPAAAVYGAATTLEHLRGRLSEEEEDELRRVILTESERLATLVDQLLDISRLDSDALTIKRQRIGVRDRVQEIVESLAASSKIRVESAPDLQVDADPLAFERIMNNLLVNALRHGAPPIVVSAARTNRHARITVEDRGPGVPLEFRSRLFEQFTRDPASEGKAGSGLGLAIARSYAQAHGGDVLYAEANPHGARFELVLPA
jgi:two-component system sensor histidine kinase MtrB